MNILFYCDEYPPARNGGIGTVVKLVAEAMASRGHKVYVVGDYSTQNQNFERLSRINEVEIIRFSKDDFRTPKRNFFLLLLFLVKKAGIKKLVKKIELSLVIDKQKKIENLVQKLIDDQQIELLELVDYQDFLLHAPEGKIKFHKYSIPTIMRVHGSVSFLSHYLNNAVSESVLENDQLHFNRADAICAVSQFSAEFVKKHIVKKEIDIIYNPIETDLFHLSEHYPEAENILFFGKIVETKGAFSLIKAFNLVAEKNSNVQLVFIGNGDIEEAKKLIKNEFQNRVHFKGFMSKDELMTEIDNAYLCVLPSYFENFSMASLEVLARGRALIYTERSSGTELINDGENGWLVNPDNVNQIAEKILFAIENPKITQELAKQGQLSCLVRFSTDVIIPQMEAYYKRIITPKSPKGDF